MPAILRLLHRFRILLPRHTAMAMVGLAHFCRIKFVAIENVHIHRVLGLGALHAVRQPSTLSQSDSNGFKEEDEKKPTLT